MGSLPDPTASSTGWPPIPSWILRPFIPQRVGLHQSPPPLHRPSSECCTVVLPVEIFAANGDVGLICLCQPRGQSQCILEAGSMHARSGFHACSKRAHACSRLICNKKNRMDRRRGFRRRSILWRWRQARSLINPTVAITGASGAIVGRELFSALDVDSA